jgi:hypothetical protein
MRNRSCNSVVLSTCLCAHSRCRFYFIGSGLAFHLGGVDSEDLIRHGGSGSIDRGNGLCSWVFFLCSVGQVIGKYQIEVTSGCEVYRASEIVSFMSQGLGRFMLPKMEGNSNRHNGISNGH